MGVVMAMKGERLWLSQDGRVRYGGSKLRFRGPPKPLNGAFLACLGGTETFGPGVEQPYPDRLENLLGVTCVNFGWPNAGVDVFARDAALMECANRAAFCVLQVPGATNLGNMYYRVHPRRNDRLLEPTEALRALFPEVDFTEFHFTRHLLSHLHGLCDTRFGYVRKELSTVWQVRMRDLLDQIETRVILLWFSRRLPQQGQGRPTLTEEPSLVSREMLDAVQGSASAVVIPLQPAQQRPVAVGSSSLNDEVSLEDILPDDRAHDAAARALEIVLAPLIGTKPAARR